MYRKYGAAASPMSCLLVVTSLVLLICVEVTSSAVVRRSIDVGANRVADNQTGFGIPRDLSEQIRFIRTEAQNNAYPVSTVDDASGAGNERQEEDGPKRLDVVRHPSPAPTGNSDERRQALTTGATNSPTIGAQKNREPSDNDEEQSPEDANIEDGQDQNGEDVDEKSAAEGREGNTYDTYEYDPGAGGGLLDVDDSKAEVVEEVQVVRPKPTKQRRRPASRPNRRQPATKRPQSRVRAPVEPVGTVDGGQSSTSQTGSRSVAAGQRRRKPTVRRSGSGRNDRRRQQRPNRVQSTQTGDVTFGSATFQQQQQGGFGSSGQLAGVGFDGFNADLQQQQQIQPLYQYAVPRYIGQDSGTPQQQQPFAFDVPLQFAAADIGAPPGSQFIIQPPASASATGGVNPFGVPFARQANPSSPFDEGLLYDQSQYPQLVRLDDPAGQPDLARFADTGYGSVVSGPSFLDRPSEQSVDGSSSSSAFVRPLGTSGSEDGGRTERRGSRRRGGTDGRRRRTKNGPAGDEEELENVDAVEQTPETEVVDDQQLGVEVPEVETDGEQTVVEYEEGPSESEAADGDVEEDQSESIADDDSPRDSEVTTRGQTEVTTVVPVTVDVEEIKKKVLEAARAVTGDGKADNEDNTEAERSTSATTERSTTTTVATTNNDDTSATMATTTLPTIRTKLT